MENGNINVVIKGERDRKVRSIAKTVSWRVISIIITFITAWLITKNLAATISIVSVRELIVIFIFYFHERFWGSVRWGKFRLEKMRVPPAEK